MRWEEVKTTSFALRGVINRIIVLNNTNTNIQETTCIFRAVGCMRFLNNVVWLQKQGSR